MQAVTATMSSVVQRLCQIQKAPSYDTPPHPLALSFFLPPLLQCSLRLGVEAATDVQSGVCRDCYPLQKDASLTKAGSSTKL